MKIKNSKFLLITLALGLISGFGNAQVQIEKKYEQKKTRILFVFDASNSMNAMWDGQPKIAVARELMADVMDSLKNVPMLELGLRMYGHQTKIIHGKQDCDDTKLVVPIGRNTQEDIKTEIQNVVPKGTTPIARSIEKAGYDFSRCSSCRNIIILITDGIEACDEDPCAVSRALQRNGIILKPFVIGLGLDPDLIKTFECVGNYYDASDKEMFRHVLNVVITQALNNTTAQVNLNNTNGKPLETNVPFTLYDIRTGAIKYNFVHTLNHYGNPDTLRLDPLSRYRLVVHTIPQVVVDSIELTPGIHNIIAAHTPQGLLELKMTGNRNDYRDLVALIRQQGKNKTLHVQNFKGKTRYLTGMYDLEILTLPRTIIKDVEISQSHTTEIEIPQPGNASIQLTSPGYGAIFLEKDSELIWVTNLAENTTKENILLQPGNYRLVYRSKNSKETIFTHEQQFTINSGVTSPIKI